MCVVTPGADVTVEGGRGVEHVRHVRHRRDVPCADVGVERRPVVEQLVHVAHRAHVPVGDRTVRRRRRARARQPRRRGRADVAVDEARAALAAPRRVRHAQRRTPEPVDRALIAARQRARRVEGRCQSCPAHHVPAREVLVERRR